MKKLILMSLLVTGVVFAQVERQTNPVESPVVPFVPNGTLIQDPGFEAGPSGGVWTESSTNFGTPICDVGSCGTGGGTGPNSGNFWAWFGGISFFEEGSVAQTVTFPGNSLITMNFFLEAPVCNSDGFIELLVDGNQEFVIDETSSLCNVVGYSQQSVDLSAYSGQTVNVEFHSIINQTGADTVNFFIDDISVDVVDAGPPPVIPSLQTYGLITLLLLLMFVTYRKTRVS